MPGPDPASAAAEGVQRGDEDARERLIDATAAMVTALARPFAGRVPLDDLRQSGALGVLRAARTFDPSRGVRFETYASRFVVGEMLALVRGAGGATVTRGGRELAALVDRTVDALTAGNGRSPTIAEVAAAAGLEPDQVVDGMRARAAMAPAADDAAALEAPDEGSELAAAEARLELGPRLAHLDDRSRRILVLRFGLELSQREISERIGISQMHVSRLLRAALAQIDRDPEPGERTG